MAIGLAVLNEKPYGTHYRRKYQVSGPKTAQYVNNHLSSISKEWFIQFQKQHTERKIQQNSSYQSRRIF